MVLLQLPLLIAIVIYIAAHTAFVILTLHCLQCKVLLRSIYVHSVCLLLSVYHRLENNASGYVFLARLRNNLFVFQEHSLIENGNLLNANN